MPHSTAPAALKSSYALSKTLLALQPQTQVRPLLTTGSAILTFTRSFKKLISIKHNSGKHLL